MFGYFDLAGQLFDTSTTRQISYPANTEDSRLCIWFVMGTENPTLAAEGISSGSEPELKVTWIYDIVILNLVVFRGCIFDATSFSCHVPKVVALDGKALTSV